MCSSDLYLAYLYLVADPESVPAGLSLAAGLNFRPAYPAGPVATAPDLSMSSEQMPDYSKTRHFVDLISMPFYKNQPHF